MATKITFVFGPGLSSYRPEAISSTVNIRIAQAWFHTELDLIQQTENLLAKFCGVELNLCCNQEVVLLRIRLRIMETLLGVRILPKREVDITTEPLPENLRLSAQEVRVLYVDAEHAVHSIPLDEKGEFMEDAHVPDEVFDFWSSAYFLMNAHLHGQFELSRRLHKTDTED